MILYADTSGLTKLFLQEQGSAEMRAAAGGAERVASALIAYAELRAVLAAAIRDRRIRLNARGELIAAVERLWSVVFTIAVDEALVRHAGELAERMRLSGYDAVHLAALQAAGDPSAVTFACWDTELRNAARLLGYRLVPV